MNDPLARGQEAFLGRAWSEAYDHLHAADDQSSLELEDLDRLADAAYLTGRDAESAEVYARAHHTWLRGGQPGASREIGDLVGRDLAAPGDHAQGGGDLRQWAAVIVAEPQRGEDRTA